jgi:PAS domain S-box-containing protein
MGKSGPRTASKWRGRLTLAFFAAPVLIILAYAYYSQQLFEASLIEQFQRHQLTSVRSASWGISERLKNIEAEIKHDLASDPAIIGTDRSQYRIALEKVYEELEDYVHGLYRLDTKGVVKMRYPEVEDLLGTEVPVKDVLGRALASPGTVVTDYFSPTSRTREISAITAVVRDDKPVGAVLAVVDIHALAKELLIPIKMTKQSQLFLTDEEGLILYHTDHSNVGRRLQEVGRGDFLSHILSDSGMRIPRGHYKYLGPGGGEELIAFSTIDFGSKRLVLTKAALMAELAGPIRRHRTNTWVFSAVLVSLVAVGAYKFTQMRNQRQVLEMEQKRAEEVEATKAFYERIVGYAGDSIVVIDNEGTILAWNVGAERIFGWSAEEALGQSYLKLQAAALDGESLKGNVNKVLTGEELHAENRRIRKDGTWFDALITASPIRDDDGEVIAAMGIIKDITERKRAEDKILKAQARLEYLLVSSPAVIWTAKAGDDWGATFISSNVRDQLGYEPEDFIDDSGFWVNHLHPDDKERVLAELPRLLENDHHVHEYRFMHKDGTYRWMRAELNLVRGADGKELECIGFWADVTERMEREEELKKAHQDLQGAYESLELAQSTAVASEKLAALGRLTAGVSHEILNPLNAITIGLHLLINEPDTPAEMRDSLQEIMDQTRRITKISQDLLYFSRQRLPERRQLDLNEAVQRTYALVEHEFRLKNVDVSLRLSEGIPPVLADEDQLQQVVLNLLNNAQDVLPKGGRLVVRTSEVEPVFAHEGRTLELRVEDSGPGINPAHLDKIFDPFFTTKPEGEGTGLGLSICQGIVESHGGSIWAEEAQDGGAAFVIRMGAMKE